MRGLTRVTRTMGLTRVTGVTGGAKRVDRATQPIDAGRLRWAIAFAVHVMFSLPIFNIIIWGFPFEAQKGQQKISLRLFNNNIATVNVDNVSKSNDIWHQIQWCAVAGLMRAAIVELQRRIKSWQKLHPTEKSDALGAAQTPPLLPPPILQSKTHLSTSHPYTCNPKPQHIYFFQRQECPHPSLSTPFSYRFLRCLRGVATQKVIFRKKQGNQESRW